MSEEVLIRIPYDSMSKKEYYLIKQGPNYYRVDYCSTHSRWEYVDSHRQVPSDGEYYDIVTKLRALKNAVNNFLFNVSQSAPQDSRVAIVTYGSPGESRILTGSSVDNALVNIVGGGHQLCAVKRSQQSA
jgi:hypothetical protein